MRRGSCAWRFDGGEQGLSVEREISGRADIQSWVCDMVGLCRVGRGSQLAVTQAVLWRAAGNKGRWAVSQGVTGLDGQPEAVGLQNAGS